MTVIVIVMVVFGRSTAQAIALKEHLPVDMVMNLDVPRQTIMDRLTDRWIHPGSGRVYAYAYRPPKVCMVSRPNNVAFSSRLNNAASPVGTFVLNSMETTFAEAAPCKGGVSR